LDSFRFHSIHFLIHFYFLKMIKNSFKGIKLILLVSSHNSKRS
jgi:hypothetical protein